MSTKATSSDSRTTKDRLEWVRESHGYGELRAFWRQLTDDGFEISYDAARTYHLQGREPPAAYLARIAEVFGVRMEWLATGRGFPTQAELVELERWHQRELLAAFARGFPRFDELGPLGRAAIREVFRRLQAYAQLQAGEGRADLPLWHPAAPGEDMERAEAVAGLFLAPFTDLDLEPAAAAGLDRHVVLHAQVLLNLIPIELNGVANG